MKVFKKISDAIYNGDLCTKIRLFIFFVLAVACLLCDVRKNWLILSISILGVIEAVYELKNEENGND